MEISQRVQTGVQISTLAVDDTHTFGFGGEFDGAVAVDLGLSAIQ